MITLATLADATAQEVFDQVTKHLLTQNEVCTQDQACMYHYNGLMCAAGCLISDEEYDPRMDEPGEGWAHIVDNFGASDHHFELICDLQSTHDNAEVTRWKIELENLAETYDLDFNPPQGENHE